MVSRAMDMTLPAFESTFVKRCTTAIVREPLVVSPETTVNNAIAQMSSLRSLCQMATGSEDEPDKQHLGSRSSCVIVVEEEAVIGILTERDIVRLGAQQRPLHHLTVQEVMVNPVITLHETDFTDLFHAANLLQQHHIRHLPILDEQNRLTGLVTRESLQQIFEPMNLLQLRLVEEVMTPRVICATPDSSMLHIAQCMAHHRISCIVLTEMVGSTVAPSQIPVGILTERDLVQFQALELNLENCTAQSMMSTPVFAIAPEASLWAVHLLMEKRRIRRLVVTGTQGELLGIITQSNLLQALNPLELYKLAEILEAKVVRLEAEKLALLEERNIELEQQVAIQTAMLKAKVNREKLLSDLATQIRASLNVQQILAITVEQIRGVLGCDRVTIWQFEADGYSIVVAESTASPISLIGKRLQDMGRQDDSNLYAQGQIRVVPDIYTAANRFNCYEEMLIHCQTRAQILVPLLCSDEVWGLLSVTESHHARDWESEEIELLRALSVQLTIALQQATAYQTAQAELAERKQAEATLALEKNRFRAIFDNMFQFIGLLAPDGTLLEANKTALTAGGVLLEEVVGRPLWETYWWQIAPTTQVQLQQAIAEAAQGEFVRYEVEVWGAHKIPIPIDFSLRPIMDDTSQVVLIIAEGCVLTRTKRLEIERQRAFADLHQSEQRYASLAAAVPVGIFRTDALGQCIYVNDRWCQITGLNPTDALGEGWQHGLHPDDRDQIVTAWEKAVQENCDIQREFRFQCPDGTVTWVYGQIVAEQATNGQITGYVGTITDISDRKRTEAERLQAEQNRRERTLLEQILDIVLAGYWDWDIPNHQEYLSPGFKRMFGYEAHELPNTPESWQHLIFPEDLLKVLDSFELHVQSRGKVPYCNEVRYRHKDGSTVWVLCSGQVIKWDEVGNPLRMIGCHIDISDRKQAEQALILSETRFRTLIDSLPFGIWVRDATDRLVLQNTADIHRFGVMLGSPIEALDIPQEVKNLYWKIKEDCQIGESVSQETTEIVAGEERSFLRIETVVPDAVNDSKGTLGAAIDITAQKQAEEKTRRYSAQLEVSNRELEAFAYSVSHDLRAPLRVIDGFSRALLEDYGNTFTKEAQDYLNRIRKSVTRMDDLIDALLSLSQVSRATIHYTRVNLSVIAHEVIAELQSPEPEHQIEWVIVPDAIVWGDTTLMRIALMNLLQNASKFTSHHATARIEFGILQFDSYPTYFVRDDGAGFDMDYAQELFGVFQRLHGSHEFPGTGIGLATVQRVIHRHGGHIWAEGAVEQGATFYFSLPTTPG